MKSKPISRRHILITGPSGSGKTALAESMRERGLNGVDADAVLGLCGWFDESGRQVTYPESAGKDFLDHNRFLWERSALVRFLETQDDVFLCGISRNVFEMIDLFDAVFFLKAAPEVLSTRLQSPRRINPMGKSSFQREYSLFWAAKNEALAKRHGVKFIDASMPLNEVIDAVLDAINRFPGHA